MGLLTKQINSNILRHSDHITAPHMCSTIYRNDVLLLDRLQTPELIKLMLIESADEIEYRIEFYRVCFSLSFSAFV